MKTRILILSPALLLTLSACGPDQVRSVDEYDAVDNQTDASLRYVDSDNSDADPDTVEINCSDDAETELVLETRADGELDADSTLVITGEPSEALAGCELVIDRDDVNAIWMRGDGALTVTDEPTDLREVDLRGSGALEIETVYNDAFALTSSGSGSILIEDLVTDQFVLDSSGSAEATFKGAVEQAEFDLSGTTAVFAQELFIQNLDAEMTGDATAEVTVESELDAELNGNATLDVWGDLDVTEIVEDGESSVNFMN